MNTPWIYLKEQICSTTDVPVFNTVMGAESQISDLICKLFNLCWWDIIFWNFAPLTPNTASPMHRPMNRPACPSTKAPKFPTTTNTELNYMILLLPKTCNFPKEQRRKNNIKMNILFELNLNYRPPDTEHSTLDCSATLDPPSTINMNEVW